MANLLAAKISTSQMYQLFSHIFHRMKQYYQIPILFMPVSCVLTYIVGKVIENEFSLTLGSFICFVCMSCIFNAKQKQFGVIKKGAAN